MWVAGGRRTDIIVRTIDRLDHLAVEAESPITHGADGVDGRRAGDRAAGAGQVVDVQRAGARRPLRAIRARAMRICCRRARRKASFRCCGIRPRQPRDYRNLGALLRFAAVPAATADRQQTMKPPQASRAETCYSADCGVLSRAVLATVLAAARAADRRAHVPVRGRDDPRRPRRQLRRPLRHLERRVGRAHAGRRSAARARRQHLLPASRERSSTRRRNLGAGALAIPAYWATRNPYFALNFVVPAVDAPERRRRATTWFAIWSAIAGRRRSRRSPSRSARTCSRTRRRCSC